MRGGDDELRVEDVAAEIAVDTAAAIEPCTTRDTGDVPAVDSCLPERPKHRRFPKPGAILGRQQPGTLELIVRKTL
jgi:hypothetical protein